MAGMSWPSTCGGRGKGWSPDRAATGLCSVQLCAGAKPRVAVRGGRIAPECSETRILGNDGVMPGNTSKRHATDAAGFDEAKIRTMSEIARVFEFDQVGFEEALR